jgi:hypothetical protein
MHTRRIAGFLLGAWMGGSVLMLLIQSANQRITEYVLASPSAQSLAALKKTDPLENVELLMRYQAAEQNRRYSSIWEETQFGIAFFLFACLFLATQRNVFPMLFCGLMLLMVIFEHFEISPELAFRGRETDFPPGSLSDGARAGVWALGQILAWVEASKLVLGSLLAAYLFIFRARSSHKRSRSIGSQQMTAVD